ncbi:hypothetical protein F511_24749 [Dorcoceras hygrometricum]|uniref:Splicing factor 3B subunit 1-like n=1 Tax=Dorcoceras hygrometricum TaxID=472368 RepID=A0A2Z7AT88_9LAMI|nr:hypothetical protein F511_24749 [Dorcoceras hygrometricum]
MEGLIDFSEVPKYLVFDARSLFSISKGQVSISCLKKELKIEYRLLHDILAKTIFVKAGSFDAVTRERFMLMSAITFDVKVNWSRLLFDVLKEMVTPGSRHAKGYAIQICVLLKNIPGLELGESRAFPVPRVLNEKTVHRYVVINEKVGGEEITNSPRLKKTPAKKALSKKRPAVDVEVALVVKKKRTTKGKPVVIAQKAVPIQIVEGIAVAPVEHLPVPKRRIQKRKRRLVLEAVDDLVVDEPVVGGSTADHPEAATGVQEPVAGQQEVVPVAEATIDDPDAIIEQVLDQLGSVATTDGEDQPAVQLVEEADEEMSVDSEQAVDERIDTDEAMSLEDILMKIPVDVPLPSASMEITKITMGKEIKIPGVDERTWYLTSLPKIPVDDKGKEILVEKDPVKGNPTKEHYSLICADIDLLVHLRAQVIEAVDQFFHSFSFKKLETINVEEMAKKEEQVRYWGETETIRIALNRKMEPPLSWSIHCQNQHQQSIQMLDSTMIRVDGVWTVEPCCDQWVKIPRQIVQNEVPRQRSYNDTLPLISTFFKILRKRWADICIEAVAFFVSGRLLPVGSINFCRSLSVDGPVYRVAPRQSTVFALRVSQFCTIFIDYSLFNSQHVQLPSSLVFESPIVQIDQSAAFADTDEQMDIDLSDDSSLHFDENDDATASISLPAAPIPDVTEALNQLRASIEQIGERDDGDKHKDTLLLHLHHLERNLTTRLDKQDRVIGALRKDSNDQRSLTSLEIKSSHKQLSTQIASNALDVVDVRRVV